jgi:hypothetical protein
MIRKLIVSQGERLDQRQLDSSIILYILLTLERQLLMPCSIRSPQYVQQQNAIRETDRFENQYC